MLRAYANRLCRINYTGARAGSVRDPDCVLSSDQPFSDFYNLPKKTP